MLRDTTQLDFAALLRTNPDDVTARLVYADWLEEQGDSPRAELQRALAEGWRLASGFTNKRAIIHWFHKAWPTNRDTQRLFTGFTEAFLWAEGHGEDNAHYDDDGFTAEDLTFDSLKRLFAECHAFTILHADDIEGKFLGRIPYTEYDQAGHDFLLTRQGHGAGFWGGDWQEEAGERMTATAKLFGELYHYVQRGKIHLS